MNSLSPPPPHWLEVVHILEVVQRLNRVLDRELINVPSPYSRRENSKFPVLGVFTPWI